ncbi:hypothetical protein CDG79_35375 [Nostoc sp. 'Peltigera membranacea cyanobiont' 232]|nr:hypothetical protein CDG79_35375 [Nostoc sp. 'Peltigera membranacea cyanobiont' 232]
MLLLLGYTAHTWEHYPPDAASTSNTESNNYKERFTAATTKLRKSRIWSDSKKRKLLEKLLSQLEALTSVE